VTPGTSDERGARRCIHDVHFLSQSAITTSGEPVQERTVSSSSIGVMRWPAVLATAV
jgi:hypothetical protein